MSKRITEDSKDTQQTTQESPNTSETRRHLVKAAVAAPTVLSTLMARPVLGGVCTPSGWASLDARDNASGVERHVKPHGCGGRSPGAYCTPDNGDGQWPSGFHCGEPKRDANGKKICTSSKLKVVSTKIYCTDSGSHTGEQQVIDKDQSCSTLTNLFGSGFRDIPSSTTAYECLWGKKADVVANSRDAYVHTESISDPSNVVRHMIAALFNAYTVPDYMDTDTVQRMYSELSTQGYFCPAGPGTLPHWSESDVVSFIQQTFS